MHRSIPLVRTLACTSLLVGMSLLTSPAGAVEHRDTSCSPSASVKPVKKKRFGFDRVLSAARQAGAGSLLSAGVLGDSEAAQAAGAIAGAAIEGRSAASAVADAAGSREHAQAAGVVAGTAVELARQASSNCAATDASI